MLASQCANILFFVNRKIKLWGKIVEWWVTEEKTCRRGQNTSLNPFDFESINRNLENKIENQVSIQNFAVLANLFTKLKQNASFLTIVSHLTWKEKSGLF